MEIALASASAERTKSTSTSSLIVLSYILKSPLAIPPRKVLSGHSAGWDLSSVEDITIPPRTQVIVDTGLIVQFPAGTYGILKARSGLAFKHGIWAFEGVIDPDYREPIKVLLMNNSNVAYEVKAGERIVQMIIVPQIEVPIFPMETRSVPRSDHQGFGSTGRF